MTGNFRPAGGLPIGGDRGFWLGFVTGFGSRIGFAGLLRLGLSGSFGLPAGGLPNRGLMGFKLGSVPGLGTKRGRLQKTSRLFFNYFLK